jgi:hypothetical protein
MRSIRESWKKIPLYPHPPPDVNPCHMGGRPGGVVESSDRGSDRIAAQGASARHTRLVVMVMELERTNGGIAVKPVGGAKGVRARSAMLPFRSSASAIGAPCS